MWKVTAAEACWEWIPRAGRGGQEAVSWDGERCAAGSHEHAEAVLVCEHSFQRCEEGIPHGIGIGVPRTCAMLRPLLTSATLFSPSGTIQDGIGP